MRTLRKRLADRSEEGFTLIELMVVVLIIAILLAIAIPSFLGARKSAQNRAVQSNLRSVLTAEKTYAVDHDGALTATVADLKTVEPNLQLDAADITKGIVVALSPDTLTVCMTRTAASGTKWAILDNTTTGTQFYKDVDLTTCPNAAPAGGDPASFPAG
jgi:type IV pilus assembly protein PilA